MSNIVQRPRLGSRTFLELQTQASDSMIFEPRLAKIRRRPEVFDNIDNITTKIKFNLKLNPKK